MCVFSQPVISVANTQIFARPTANNSQFLVYQMSYASAHDNAMILPIPVRRPTHARSLRFIDLSLYESFFDDLAQGFPYINPAPSFGCSAHRGESSSAMLEVFEVGNYVGSFLPALADFARLDKRFSLPDSVWSKVPQYKDFGFVVFQLAEGSLRPHPMAFEFEQDGQDIFFPTLHIHDGEIHATEDFDHVLYLQHAGFDSQVSDYENSEALDRTTSLVRSKNAAKHFCAVEDAKGIVAGELLIHKKIIRGNHRNDDTRIAASGHPETPSLNLRPLLSYAPWLLFLGAISWFFARRNRLQRKTLEAESG